MAKTSSLKYKGKNPQCGYCKKAGHKEEDCWHKGKPQCFKCKRFGHLQKDCKFKNEEDKNVALEAKEETEYLF